MNSQLDRNIISTVCYYDALNYPLTAFEIWKFMIDKSDCERMKVDVNLKLEQDFSLSDVQKKLDGDDLRGVIFSSRGFYFLKNREELIDERIRRNKLSNIKIKRLRKIIWFLRLAPFVRLVLVTGRLAMKNAQVKSDWDLLIVLKNGKIWTGRTFVTLFAHLLGKRRYGNKIKDRVCLNYFVTTESMEITDKNLFSSNEYMSCFPLFDAGEYYNKFQIKNYWIRDTRLNYGINENYHLKLIRDTDFSRNVRKSLERIFNFEWLEVGLEKIEKKKIYENPKTKIEGSFIEASDECLIFLPKPQGPLVFEKYMKNLEDVTVG